MCRLLEAGEELFLGGCLVLERTWSQRGLVGYNLTVWIRETQLKLLGGLEGAGAGRLQAGAGADADAKNWQAKAR